MTEVIPLSTALENSRASAARARPAAIRTDSVYVVFTTVDETLAAVRVAASIADRMMAPLAVVHFRTVPYPLRVDASVGISPVQTDQFAARLREEGIDVHVRVVLCRYVCRAIGMAFRPHSLAVVGGRRSWWPTPSERWRRRLEWAGHLVVFVDPAQHPGREEGTHA